MMKTVVLLFTGLIPFFLQAQENVSDKLLTFLVYRTLNLSEEKVNVYKYPTIPGEIWDERKREVIENEYFEPGDHKFLKRQLVHPSLKEWDFSAFDEKGLVKTTEKNEDDLQYYFSIPLVSADQRKVVIFYESWSHGGGMHNSGAGFVCVWILKDEKEWVKELDVLIWITENQIGQPDTPFFGLRR